ncbi:MAG: cytochrome P450 [Chloroflexota bacterium]
MVVERSSKQVALPVKTPLGPKGYPFIGALPHIAANPLRCFTQAHRQYGDIVRFDVASVPVHLITNPDHLTHILVTNNQNYWKGVMFQRTAFLFGDGIVINEGESWQKQRRLMQPSFHHNQMAHLVSIMADEVQKKLALWEQKYKAQEPLDIQLEMMSLTLSIVIKAMFSFSISDREVTEVAKAFNTVLGHFDLRFLTFFLAEWVPLPGQATAQRALSLIDDIVYRLIETRRKDDGTYHDLLSLLLSARYEETNEGMNDKQLRDEIVTIFFAGYEATANALAWTWYTLAQHNDVRNKVRKEVRQVMADQAYPSFEGLRDLTYTDMVINETMRLYPPFWLSFRTTYEADEIDGYHIPANSPMLLCHYLAHRHADFWDNPHQFRPERFTADGIAARDKYTFAPFGAGQRMCIGKHFAMIEMKLIIAMMIQAYDLHLVTTHPVDLFPRATLRSKQGIFMTLHNVEGV